MEIGKKVLWEEQIKNEVGDYRKTINLMIIILHS